MEQLLSILFGGDRMTSNRKLNFIMALVMFFAIMVQVVLVQTAHADDPAPTQTPLGFGEGGAVVEPNFGGDITSLNPILIADGSSQDVANRLFPALVGRDPETGLPAPGAAFALAKSWEASKDGLTYTFKLRDDWKWSDGTVATAADVKYAFDAIRSGKVDSRIASTISTIESVEAPDATTLVVKFTTPECAAILTANAIPVVPSETYKKVYPTFADMTTKSEYNLNPTVTGGDFVFSNFRPGEQVTLLPNKDYPDSPLGYVVPKAYIYKQVADQLVGVEQFLKGDVTLISSVPEDKQPDLKALGEQGKIRYNEFPSASWHYVIFNVADPENPKNGQDEKGKAVDQGHHPIFGDKRVRQAFAYAINHDDLNKGAFNGLGQPVASPFLPQSWAYNKDLKPYAFDLTKAGQLLDEAGFVDDDNNPDTPRVANDKALYAKPGTKLEFSLLAFSGNPSVDSSTVLMQDQLKQVGFKMNLDIIEFQSMIGKLFSQKFDAAMLFLGPFTPNNPDEIRETLDPVGDVVDSGINAGSYSNPEVSDLLNKARSLPGCDQTERKALYDKAQALIMDDMPLYFVNFSMVPVVAQANIENYDPRVNAGLRWNLPVWTIREKP
jgi:peptide/nickel transport system substrate-binding protein